MTKRGIADGKTELNKKDEIDIIKFVLSNTYRTKIENRIFPWKDRKTIAELYCQDISLGEGLCVMLDLSPTTQKPLNRDENKSYNDYKDTVKEQFDIYWDYKTQTFQSYAIITKNNADRKVKKHDEYNATRLETLEVGEAAVYKIKDRAIIRHYVKKAMREHAFALNLQTGYSFTVEAKKDRVTVTRTA